MIKGQPLVCCSLVYNIVLQRLDVKNGKKRSLEPCRGKTENLDLQTGQVLIRPPALEEYAQLGMGMLQSFR